MQAVLGNSHIRETKSKCSVNELNRVIDVVSDYVDKLKVSHSFTELLETNLQINSLFFSTPWQGAYTIYAIIPASFTHSISPMLMIQCVRTTSMVCFLRITKSNECNRPVVRSPTQSRVLIWTILVATTNCWPNSVVCLAPYQILSKSSRAWTTLILMTNATVCYRSFCLAVLETNRSFSKAPECVESYMNDYLLLNQNSVSCSAFSSEEYPVLIEKSKSFRISCKERYNIDNLLLGNAVCKGLKTTLISLCWCQQLTVYELNETGDEDCSFGGVKNRLTIRKSWSLAVPSWHLGVFL